jgi:hypothetical protein
MAMTYTFPFWEITHRIGELFYTYGEDLDQINNDITHACMVKADETANHLRTVQVTILNALIEALDVAKSALQGEPTEAGIARLDALEENVLYAAQQRAEELRNALYGEEEDAE